MIDSNAEMQANPSLGRVAGSAFYNDSDRNRSYVQSNTHSHHPPSGSVLNPPRFGTPLSSFGGQGHYNKGKIEFGKLRVYFFQKIIFFIVL